MLACVCIWKPEDRLPPIPQEPSILVLETESLIGLILFIWLKSLGSEARGPAGLCLHSVLLSGVWE